MFFFDTEINGFVFFRKLFQRKIKPLFMHAFIVRFPIVMELDFRKVRKQWYIWIARILTNSAFR